jgi:hypothetical protein
LPSRAGTAQRTRQPPVNALPDAMQARKAMRKWHAYRDIDIEAMILAFTPAARRLP